MLVDALAIVRLESTLHGENSTDDLLERAGMYLQKPLSSTGIRRRTGAR
jgi:hypothetical protein